MPITKEIADKLHKSFMSREVFTSAYSVPIYDACVEVINDAGLACCLIPYKSSPTSRNVDLQLAVVDKPEDPCSKFAVVGRTSSDVKSVYALIRMRPGTDYMLNLSTVRLDKPWYATSMFFSEMCLALFGRYVDYNYESRSCEGPNRRAAFDKLYKELWTETTVVQPLIKLKLNRLLFSTFPYLEVDE